LPWRGLPEFPAAGHLAGGAALVRAARRTAHPPRDTVAVPAWSPPARAGAATVRDCSMAEARAGHNIPRSARGIPDRIPGGHHRCRGSRNGRPPGDVPSSLPAATAGPPPRASCRVCCDQSNVPFREMFFFAQTRVPPAAQKVIRLRRTRYQKVSASRTMVRKKTMIQMPILIRRQRFSARVSM